MPDAPCATGHTWSHHYGEDWSPEVCTPCDCGQKRWGIPVRMAREHQWQWYMNGTFCSRCGAQLGDGEPCR